MEINQQKQEDRHDQRSRERNFAVGDGVFVRNYHQGDQWLPGVIEQKTGPVSYRFSCQWKEVLNLYTYELSYEESHKKNTHEYGLRSMGEGL